MKLFFPQYFESKARYQTYVVVKTALEKAGHEVVNELRGCDAVLFSMCDVTEYRKLMELRRRTEGYPLIVGGAYAFNFWSAKLYSDAVWVGEVFDMADCRSVEDMFASQYCYTGGIELPRASQRVEWDDIPVVQTDKNGCYYWGGVGCKNKCRFCYTSWTHNHLKNKEENLRRAKELARKNGKFIMITSNEYDNDPTAMTFDMLLKDYIRIPVKAGKTIRMGVEFATEESRRKNGKPFSRNDLFKALQKSNAERTSLYLFHITGFDSLSDWETYIEEMYIMLKSIGTKRMLSLGFNNFQYQNYTPIYAERRNIDPDKYSTREDIARWREKLAMSGATIWAYPPMPFQHVCCRMGIELSTNKDQVDFWSNMIINAKKKMSVEQAYKYLFDSGVLDTPHLKMNIRTGEIRIAEAAK